jgi:hypothetical protein
MSKTSCKILIAVFLIFIFGFAILSLVMPDREFSEQENRYLSSAPEFSFSSLASGKYSESYEKYTSDQFPFRDKWITLKAASELSLGKTQNNDVYYCEGGAELIEQFEEPDGNLVDSNLDSLALLAENSGKSVYFMLVPTASETWRDRLPDHAQSADQREIIAYCYGKAEGTGITTVDAESALDEHADEYIYYSTDHHWTTLGAYYGFTALARTMGLDAPELGSYERTTVSDSFYGTTYSSSGYSWVQPDSIETFVSADGITVTNYPSGSPVEGTVYDESFLDKKDKYSFFYGGNTPLIHIETVAESGKSLLVLRDSYADCFTPFLYGEYADIYQIDLRYYKTSLADFIEQNDIDEILVLYSTKDFVTDTSVYLMGR